MSVSWIWETARIVYDGWLYRKIKASAACDGEDKWLQDLGRGGDLKESDNVEDIGVTGRIIVMLTLTCSMPGRRVD